MNNYNNKQLNRTLNFFDLPGVIVPELGKAEASPDFGSRAVTVSPPRFLAITESGSGVNLLRVKMNQTSTKNYNMKLHKQHNKIVGYCYVLFSPRIPLFFISGIPDLRNAKPFVFTHLRQSSSQVTKLLLNFRALLTISLQNDYSTKQQLSTILGTFSLQ